MARPPAGRSDADEPKSGSSDSRSTIRHRRLARSRRGDARRTSRSTRSGTGSSIDPVEIALPGRRRLHAPRLPDGLGDHAVRHSGRARTSRFPDRRPTDDDDESEISTRSRRTTRHADEEEVDLEDETTRLMDEDDRRRTCRDGRRGRRRRELRPSAADEEVPLFLSHGGQLLLFRSPSRSGRVRQVRRRARPDPAGQLVAARRRRPRRARRPRPTRITYELDLVVKNLRGGPDAWDPDLHRAVRPARP